MTIKAIIGFSIITIAIIIVAIGFAANVLDTAKGIIITFVISLVICVGMWLGTYWYFQNTEKGARALKTQKSNFDGGIERSVIVYDIEGDIIAEYKGKFDIEYNSDIILFDDENGLRHIIYYPTGTVVIDEIGR